MNATIKEKQCWLKLLEKKDKSFKIIVKKSLKNGIQRFSKWQIVKAWDKQIELMKELGKVKVNIELLKIKK